MIYPSQFDNIRPYTEEEIPAALQRLVKAPNFEDVVSFLYPDIDVDSVRQRILAVDSIDKFQHTVMQDAINRISERTISSFSYSGAENLQPNTPSLFISNHRDIALDAMLLQGVLDKEGCRTCQITFGANLMKHPLVVEAGRINKMFRIERGGTPRSFYQSLMQSSQYMRYVITQRHESVWIAQRNGRTKDGLDRTEPSLLKMLAQSHGKEESLMSLADLHITPIAISYENEPCDYLKAHELACSLNTEYVKSEDEDLHSIITGILQPKGQVNITICKPLLANELEGYNPSFGDPFKWVASLIDERVKKGYKLMPTNYIAHDIRSGATKYSDKYTDEQRQAFIERMQSHNMTDTERSLFIDIYANPV